MPPVEKASAILSPENNLPSLAGAGDGQSPRPVVLSSGWSRAGVGVGRGVSRTPTAFKHVQWTFLSAGLYFQRYQELPGAEPVGDSRM